jgi:bacterial/archaeal transporter family protein
MPAVEEPKVDPAGVSPNRHPARSTVDTLELWQEARTESNRRQSQSSHAASTGTRLGSKWFWYSIMSLLCWTAWALTAKVGSSKLPPATMQFVSALGFLSVSIAIAGCAKRGAHTSHKGRLYSIISGVLLAGGGLASFAAYRGGNTAATTGITSLYPAITVICALVFLKERLTRSQIVGLCFSGAAILLFSL